jgi:hypothetical protein
MRRVGFAVVGLLLALVLGGCTQWATVQSGDYVVLFDGAFRDPPGALNTQAMEVVSRVMVDRDAQTAIFRLVDGDNVQVPIQAWDQSRWPAGCPTNVASTRMEVLELNTPQLDLGEISLADPLLVHDCGGERLVLRAGGEFDPGQTACAWPADCIYLGRQVERTWRLVDLTVQTRVDQPVQIEVLPEDQAGSVILGSLAVLDGPFHGRVETMRPVAGGGFQSDGTVTYMPAPGYQGEDSFMVRVHDREGYWATAGVTISVDPAPAE